MVKRTLTMMENTSQRAEGYSMETPVKFATKMCPGLESLHSLGQPTSATLPSPQSWSKHMVLPRVTPHNLFFEGFKDCASEVIRFLTEVEMVEDNNPLVLGLQSHLNNVSAILSNKTRTNTDAGDRDTEHCASFSSTNNVNDVWHASSHNVFTPGCGFSSYHTPSAFSPTTSRSANSSVSDTSAVDSDMTLSTLADKSCQSTSSENDLFQSTSSENDLFQSTSSENDLFQSTSSENDLSQICRRAESLDFVKNDDVFQCLESSLLTSVGTHSVTTDQSSSVLSLKQLATLALKQRDSSTNNIHFQLQEEPGIYRLISEDHLIPEELLHYLQPVGQSSPLASSSPDRLQSTHEQNFHPRLPSANVSSHPFNLSPCSADDFSAVSPDYIPAQPAELPSEPLSSQPLSRAQEYPEVPAPPVPQQISSILELKANFLPGIDTTSVASGNFADILLSIESCRFHEDSRVRALADELLHLIHDEMEDDDDDFEDDVDEGGDNHRNYESGIEMMDESIEWGNPADMIEQ